MKEIRIHARAGQGAITTAMLLSMAAFEEGKEALAFPHFGAQRMGAPMNAYVRLSDKPIRIRSGIENPDYILVIDPTLLRMAEATEAEGGFILGGFNVLAGLKPTGMAIINIPQPPSALNLPTPARVVTIPASGIAEEIVGRADRANTAILGAFAAATGEVSIETLKRAVRKAFPGVAGEKNAQAMQKAYDLVKEQSG